MKMKKLIPLCVLAILVLFLAIDAAQQKPLHSTVSLVPCDMDPGIRMIKLEEGFTLMVGEDPEYSSNKNMKLAKNESANQDIIAVQKIKKKFLTRLR